MKRKFILIALLNLSCSQIFEPKSSVDYRFLSSYFLAQPKSSSVANTPVDFFSSSVDRVKVNILYESSVTPSTNSIDIANNLTLLPMSLLEKNLQAIFQFQPQSVQVVVPQTTDEMIRIENQNKEDWTIDEVRNLIKIKFNPKIDAKIRIFYVAYLKGYYKENGVINKKIAGINIMGTPYIAIFTDAIDPSGNAKKSLPQIFKEQSILIHEIGHAVGLVNNGIPLASAHQDNENGVHCINKSCVMYWSTGNNAAIGNLISNFISKGESVFFQSECMEDIKKFSTSPQNPKQNLPLNQDLIEYQDVIF